ncbi:hypothetical protein JG688_00010418, partial [Phytophthora aleatoria]
MTPVLIHIEQLLDEIRSATRAIVAEASTQRTEESTVTKTAEYEDFRIKLESEDLVDYESETETEDEAAVEQEKEKQDEHELMGGIGVKRSREDEDQGKEEEPGLKRQELDVVPKANHESRLRDNLASFVRQARECLELSEDEAAPTVWKAITGGTDSPDYAQGRGLTKFDIPGEYDNIIYNGANEQYRVEWISDAYMWLGKLVGGCSSINAALYFRPPDSFVTNTQWPFSAAQMVAKMNENEQLHGHTDRPSSDGTWYTQEGYSIVSRALLARGYAERTINDAAARNSKSKTFGHAPFTFKNGKRDTPATAFWGQMSGRSNVLIQSGVGPSSQLNLLNGRNGFPGVSQAAGWVTNANVGRNLFDTNVVFASFSHPQMSSFQYKNKPSWAINQYMNQGFTGPWSSSGPTLVSYENYDVQGRTYEFQSTALTNGFGEFYSRSNAFTLALYVNNPESRAASGFDGNTNWKAFNEGTPYFGTSRDLAALQSYAQRTVSAMVAQGATFLSAGSDDTSVTNWVAANRGLITHHFGGSCYASSNSGDTKRCADEKLRVIGMSNVFVADGSAMRDGTVNPYGFIMYIGREAADQAKAYIAANTG